MYVYELIVLYDKIVKKISLVVCDFVQFEYLKTQFDDEWSRLENQMKSQRIRYFPIYYDHGGQSWLAWQHV